MSPTRLRRRLLVSSAPVAIVVVLALVKLWSVVISGGAAGSDFADRDVNALRSDVDALKVFNVIEPAKAHLAEGSLAVLEGRLDEAVEEFSAALAHTDPAQSCPVRVNLELVGETLGDRAAAALNGRDAVARYRGALQAVEQAPRGCFTGSTDPDGERRAVLQGAAARLRSKIDASLAAPPPPPPPPEVVSAPPPPPPPATTAIETDQQLRLNPGAGDPLDRLQQILRDASSAPG